MIKYLKYLKELPALIGSIGDLFGKSKKEFKKLEDSVKLLETRVGRIEDVLE